MSCNYFKLLYIITTMVLWSCNTLKSNWHMISHTLFTNSSWSRSLLNDNLGFLFTEGLIVLHCLILSCFVHLVFWLIVSFTFLKTASISKYSFGCITKRAKHVITVGGKWQKLWWKTCIVCNIPLCKESRAIVFSSIKISLKFQYNYSDIIFLKC